MAFFLLRGTSDAQCRIRNGFQAGLGDLHAAYLALAIAAILDPLECRFNLVEGVFFAPQQTQREFLIELPLPSSAMSVGMLVVLLWSLFRALSSI